ncbi:MAG: DHH family phosphoesterase [Halodesulfurarchaeum sp.]
MVTRLVLGCDGICSGLLEGVIDSQGEMHVVDSESGRIDQLRNRGVSARTGDVTDSGTIQSLGIDPDIVLVLGESPEQNLEATSRAREHFPDAIVISATGDGATFDQRSELDRLADTVISPGALIIEYLDDLFGGETLSRLRHLRETLSGMDGTLGVFMHDNPDPDAISAAISLVAIAEYFGVEAVPCYFGEITHQENRAFVNLLGFDLENLEDDEEVSFDHYALIDHARPGVNDQLPEETPIEIVIDHHLPTSASVDAEFVDIRPDIGATSTMLVDYIRGYDVDIESEVATGLLYGIRVDTKDFAQNATVGDFEAAAFLVPRADTEILQRVENPTISPETMDIVARAIQNREVRGPVLSSCVGSFSDRDAIAQAADRLLNMEDVDIVLVYGYRSGTVVVSARARGVDVHLGQLLRRAFDDIGSAGGHGNMAGAQIPLGIFDDVEEGEEAALTEMVEEIITEHLFRAIDIEDIEE